ncbi:MAG TPA: cytochrome b [Trinickia sp.]|jgi:cytochrome b561|nr:cytochrome b [Trinickia sp.]
MSHSHTHFSVVQRLLHWIMAILILAMLFIGVAMVATVSRSHETLIAIHRPLGVALLVLVAIRAIARMKHGNPPLPHDLPSVQRLGAKASHHVLYLLMAAMPLIGWGMLSAGGYPVTMFGALHLPPILPHDVRVFALLRALHTWLAYALFATVLLHLAAALMHGLIRRDGVLASMTWGRGRV